MEAVFTRSDFRVTGWITSPFNIYPAKGRCMVRDIGRIAAARGFPFNMPETFPVNRLKAARLAIAAESFGGKAAFSRAVFNAQFAMGLDLSNDGVLTACLTLPGLDADAVWARSKDDDVKGALRRNTEEAQAIGIFGARALQPKTVNFSGVTIGWSKRSAGR
jgi:2-hydroxychromene-2-carboxylate isomerase